MASSSPTLPGAFPQDMEEHQEWSGPPFPLLDCPQEIILQIVARLDERLDNSTFPSGPSTELIRLSETNHFFHSVCRPLIWRSANVGAVSPQPGAILRPPEYTERRGLRALRQLIIEASEHMDHESAQEEQWSPGPLPLKAFSFIAPEYGYDDDEVATEEDEQELHALLDIIRLLGNSDLQVLFLHRVELKQKLAEPLLEAILRLPKLSALRLNQVELKGKMEFLKTIDSLPNLRTLQIMHSSPLTFQITRLCPNIESLLLWPSSRKFGPLIDVIAAKLPQIRLLSLDAVREPACFVTLANKLSALSDAGTPSPLEELMLEGPQTTPDRQTLVSALAQAPSLTRLALYHLRDARPSVVADLAAAVPHLKALTLVHGSTDRPVYWPAPLPEYLPQLAKFPHLEFFAFDRRSPTVRQSDGAEVDSMRAEYETLKLIGGACKELKEAVAIVQDVSEGSSGYFAEFDRVGKATRIKVHARTVKDFLVGFSRWCVIAE